MTDQEEYPVSNEFITFVRIQLDHEQKQQLNRFLNLHYLGDVNSNEMNGNGRYVAKYPEKETEEFKNAIWRINATHEYQVKVVYSVDGTCRLELP
jgi:hypothetical protein